MDPSEGDDERVCESERVLSSFPVISLCSVYTYCDSFTLADMKLLRAVNRGQDLAENDKRFFQNNFCMSISFFYFVTLPSFLGAAR